MAVEIERKYLVKDDRWRASASPGAPMRQGYLAVTDRSAIRVRLEGGAALLNIKQATLDIRRDEFEYPIPADDAESILTGLCVGHIIEKTRYEVVHEGFTWEIDVFHGVNEGLTVAEVELDAEDAAPPLPPWAGVEVSLDARYLNANLAIHPYQEWS